MKILRSLLLILKDYCLNSSLACVGYLANTRYHFSERILWLILFIISVVMACHLINDEILEFRKGSVDTVMKSVEPQDNIIFPSIGVCEMGNTKESYSKLVEIVENLNPDPDSDDYAFDVEDFLYRVIFHNLYNYGSVLSYCEPYRHCTDCTKCPEGNYSEYTDKVKATCAELISKCYWNNKEFDCCKYFKPARTSLGVCYLINSINTVKKNGPHWLNMQVEPNERQVELRLSFLHAASVFIINEEDIPHILLTRLQFNNQHEGKEIIVPITLHNVLNDESVRSIEPEKRKCKFPNEVDKDSLYGYYSYSTCVTECLKRAQIKICNCSHHNMIFGEKDPNKECGYDGLACLDDADLIFPLTTIMQPWRKGGLVCDCLPSCTENEINIVGKYQKSIDTNERIFVVSLLDRPSVSYFRQAVRVNLDVVVSIGGILGLFLGASILSGIEFIHFFTVRWIGNIWLKKQRLRGPN